ncbi:hypothetical protein V6N13_109400 [Hibiscus sabdariffa]
MSPGSLQTRKQGIVGRTNKILKAIYTRKLGAYWLIAKSFKNMEVLVPSSGEGFSVNELAVIAGTCRLDSRTPQ